MIHQLATFAAIESPFTLFEPVFAQRAAVAVALVCVLSAAVGPTIVLRDLPFFTHAIGAGAYPALVLAVAIGIAISTAALIGALAFGGVLWMLIRGTGAAGDRRDAITGIAVAAALGLGAVLASTVASGNQRLVAPPEALLFGSVLTVQGSTLLTTGLAALLIVALAFVFGDRWLAGGFDSGVASQLGVARLDALLMLTVALAAGATLPVTGSLMAGSLLVVPAATARLVSDRAVFMAPITLLIAITEGALGLYVSLAFDLPTGATIAAAAGIGFVVVALAIQLRKAARRAAMRPAIAPLAVMALLAVTVSGCGSSTGDNNNGSDAAINVVATTTQVGDIARQVGGNAVVVTTILEPGVDPHSFEPRPSTVAALADADVIVRSGSDVDSWLAPALEAANNSRKPLDLSNAATVTAGDANDQQFNAHWYLSSANLAAAAQRVRDELIKSDPNARESLRANTTAYLGEIDSATAALKSCVSELPRADRAIITGHDDFDYLTQQFGFRIAGQLADTGEAEPSARDVQDAVDAARAGNAKALVMSKGEVPKLATEVSKKLDIPLLELYSDSLAKNGEASTALGAIAFNVGAIVKAASGGAITCKVAAAS